MKKRYREGNKEWRSRAYPKFRKKVKPLNLSIVIHYDNKHKASNRFRTYVILCARAANESSARGRVIHIAGRSTPSGRVKASQSRWRSIRREYWGILYKCSHSRSEAKEFFYISTRNVTIRPDDRVPAGTGSEPKTGRKRWGIGLSPAGSEHDRRPSALDKVSTRIAWMRGSEGLAGWRGGHHRWFRYSAVEMAASRRQTGRTAVTGM